MGLIGLFRRKKSEIKWLKNDVCEYIKSKVEFYNMFGEGNKNCISDELK